VSASTSPSWESLPEQPWGLQLDGHPPIINYFVPGDAGRHDTVLRTGHRNHKQVQGPPFFGRSKNRGLDLLLILDNGQGEKAILNLDKTNYNRTEAF
jgi:hypothetical protein